MWRLGGWEIVLVVMVVLIIFGPKRLPSLGKSMAEFFRNIKGGLKDISHEVRKVDTKIKS